MSDTPFIWRLIGSDIVNPPFNNVTIDNSNDGKALMTVIFYDENVKCVGQWSPFDITAKNINEILMLGSGKPTKPGLYIVNGKKVVIK